MTRLACTLFALSLLSCSHNETKNQLATPSLSQSYSEYFTVGAAIDHRSYQTHKNVLLHHFNAVVAENELKFESLQPEPGVFTFSTADKMLSFAQDNNLYTRGHALVWHRQTPEWVFEDENGEVASAELLRVRMKSHITTVMQRYQGKVDAWDVVNEAIMDDGSYRTHLEDKEDQKSRWYEILGESYIEDAFRMAKEADPSAKLFYNDYYNYLPERQNAIYTMLKGLLDKGVPIDGVGLQCHLNVHTSDDPEHQSHYQTIENLERAIHLYSSLGLDVQITELDVSVYTGGKKYTKENFYTKESFDLAFQEKQAQRYRELFAMFRRNHELISNVTFWGIADDNTWLSEFDSGRQDFPLLFDLAHEPKPAFDAVIRASSNDEFEEPTELGQF